MKMTARLMKTSLVLALFAATGAQAINWDNGGVGNDWSTAANWAGDNVPDNNTEEAAYAFAGNQTVNVDSSFTIQKFRDLFSGGAGQTVTLSGPGSLTIDLNSAGAGNAIENLTGAGVGSTLVLDCDIIINNSLGGDSRLAIGNNPSNNVIRFGSSSTLTWNTPFKVYDPDGRVEFNGVIAASSDNLLIDTANVSFGDGHDSSAFGKDIVFSGTNRKLVIDGGTVLNSGRKFQVNGTGSELELNGENAINDANIVVGGANNFLIDANAGQDDMGFLKLGTGTLTLDAEGASLVAFDDSSAQIWGGAVVISNFTSGSISFGTTSNGITSAQFSAITAYDRAGAEVADLAIDENGFLTGTVTPSQLFVFNNSSGLDSSWSNTGNWSTAVLPSANDYVQLNNANFDMDVDATVKQIYSSFGTLNGTPTSSGGTLTVDIYSATALDGIWSAYNASNLSSTITFDGNVVIKNSLGAAVNTYIGVKNDRPNATLAFGPNSVLTLNSRVETMGTGYGTIELNGTLLGSQALRINSSTVVLGVGHDSSSFGSEFVIIGSGSKLVVDGGTVLAASRKVQVNADGAIELNGADSFNAYISMINNKQLLVDVNADQNAMGRIIMGSGDALTLDLATNVTVAAFAKTLDDWQDSTLAISNFSNGVVSFGSDTNGLLAANLDNIEAYDAGGSPVTGIQIDSMGRLTTNTSLPIGTVAVEIINGGADITMGWEGLNGASYTVSNTTDLVSGSWVLWTNGLIGTGGDLVITDVVDQVQSFYRISGQ